MAAGCEELLEAIEQTKKEIYRLKQQMNNTDDNKERYRIRHKLKELRKMQFQQIKQLG